MTNSEQELKPEQLLQGRVDYLEHEIARYKVANAKLAAMVDARPTPTPDDAALDALERVKLHIEACEVDCQDISNDLNKIRQALTNACKVQTHLRTTPEGWHPIETAPKDGNEIFVLQNSGRVQRVKYIIDQSDYFAGWVDFQDETNDFTEKWFIGWLPIAAAPQPKAE